MTNYTPEQHKEDREIAEEVYRIHFHSLQHLRDDMIQDAIIKLWAKRKQFKSNCAYKTFATTAAKNAMFDFVRREHNHMEQDTSIFEPITAGEDKTYMDILPDLLMDVEHMKLKERMETMQYNLVKGCVKRVLRCFNIDERKVITLIIKGFTYRQIEEELGVSKSYVGVLVKRFKSEVAKELCAWGLNQEYKEYKKWIC